MGTVVGGGLFYFSWTGAAQRQPPPEEPRDRQGRVRSGTTSELSRPGSQPWSVGPCSVRHLGSRLGVQGSGEGGPAAWPREGEISSHFQPMVLPNPQGSLSSGPCGQEQRSTLTSSPGQSSPSNAHFLHPQWWHHPPLSSSGNRPLYYTNPASPLPELACGCPLLCEGSRAEGAAQAGGCRLALLAAFLLLSSRVAQSPGGPQDFHLAFRPWGAEGLVERGPRGRAARFQLV